MANAHFISCVHCCKALSDYFDSSSKTKCVLDFIRWMVLNILKQCEIVHNTEHVFTVVGEVPSLAFY